jgi:type II secretory pathway component PulK
MAGAGSNLAALAVASVASEEGVALAVVLVAKAVVEAMAAAMVAEVKVAARGVARAKLDSMDHPAATTAWEAQAVVVAVLFQD